MEHEFCTYISTHNTKEEGGHKTHIGFYELGKPICGRKNLNYHCTFPDNGIDEEYIIVGINSGQICLKCGNKALDLISNSLN